MVRLLLVLLSLAALADGIVTLNAATSAFHQMIGMLALAIAAILFTGAAVVDAVVDLKKRVEEQLKMQEAASKNTNQ